MTPICSGPIDYLVKRLALDRLRVLTNILKFNFNFKTRDAIVGYKDELRRMVIDIRFTDSKGRASPQLGASPSDLGILFIIRPSISLTTQLSLDTPPPAHVNVKECPTQ